MSSDLLLCGEVQLVSHCACLRTHHGQFPGYLYATNFRVVFVSDGKKQSEVRVKTSCLRKLTALVRRNLSKTLSNIYSSLLDILRRKLGKQRVFNPNKKLSELRVRRFRFGFEKSYATNNHPKKFLEEIMQKSFSRNFNCNVCRNCSTSAGKFSG